METVRHSDVGRTSFWILCALGAILALFLLAPAFASAASLRVCITDNTSPDIATAPVYLNGNPFNPDMLLGSTVSASGRCNALPIPATLAKGQNFTATVTYKNAVGEESVPSNGIPFRNPGAPPVPILNSLSLVAP